MKIFKFALTTALASSCMIVAAPAFASSHREAPAITERPKVDGTDLYAFRSYEPGREGFVTIIANYQPSQDSYAGPNYFTMDPDALYEIHIDSDGDAVEDLTFSFDFDNALRDGVGKTISVGGKTLPIALRSIGPVTSADDPDLGETESYSLTVTQGDRRTGTKTVAGNFRKPLDNVGNKTIPDYAAYATPFISAFSLPGCATPGRVFAGQRAEAFAVNLGAVFDLVNIVPVDGASGFPGGITQSRANDDLVGEKNITSLAIEVPISCVRGAGNGVIGVWQTASLPQGEALDPTPTYRNPTSVGGAFTQVSRLGMPLVNELVIGLPFKDLFNAAEPNGDAALADFVTNPTIPAVLNALFRGPVNAALGANLADIAPNNFPRNDLVASFLTGIRTLNQQSRVTPSEMLRLNTGVNPTARAAQSTFGVAGDDLAGFPNGRRPGDDVVDIVLRVAMGRLCHPVPINGTPTDLGLCTPANAPVGLAAFTDGAPISATELQNVFPYLNNPIPGSPREAR
jgi:Domain of unknown function (DUF4331)